MIADLLPTRLWWEGGRGVARLHGREVVLTAPPQVPGLDVVAIDWAPGEASIVMPRNEGWRDLHPHEVAAVRALLEHLTKGLPDAHA